MPPKASIITPLPHDGISAHRAITGSADTEATWRRRALAGVAVGATATLAVAVALRQPAVRAALGLPPPRGSVGDVVAVTNRAQASAVARCRKELRSGLHPVDTVSRLLGTVGLPGPMEKALVAKASEVVVEFTEFVTLPDHSTAECVELGVPVRGEVRVFTFLNRTCRVTLKLAAPPSSGATSSIGGGGATSSMGGRVNSVQGSLPTHGPAVAPRLDVDGATVLHDMIDYGLWKKTGDQLRFLPARCESYVLMNYEAVTADEVSPAIIARECCLQPGSTAGQFLLTIAIEVVTSARDVCVSIDLPKHSEVRGNPIAPTKGSWGRPTGGAATELQWLIGDVLTDTEGLAATASVASTHGQSPPHDQQRRAHTVQCTAAWEYCVPQGEIDASFRSNPNTPRSPPRRRATSRAGVEELNEDDDNDVNVAPSGRRARMTPRSRLEPRNAGRHPSAFDNILPIVSFSYATPQSASGVAARRVVVEEADGAGGWRATPVDGSGGKLARTTASYRTNYSQAVLVDSML